MISAGEMASDHSLDPCQPVLAGSAPQSECLSERERRPAIILAMDREKACVLLRKSQPSYFNAFTVSYDALHVRQLAIDLNVWTSPRCHL